MYFSTPRDAPVRAYDIIVDSMNIEELGIDLDPTVFGQRFFELVALFFHPFSCSQLFSPFSLLSWLIILRTIASGLLSMSTVMASVGSSKATS